ncbi:MAG TPA: hypothetical protein VMU83_21465 [Hanamia sp.]|nr:hypothetical protein [Hanamia sp.]
MNFPFYINISWIWFCIGFGAISLIGFIMHLQSKNFYTLHVFVRKFSIIDLEFPASPLELATYIKGIFLLPKELSAKSLRALNGQLYLHLLFIPLLYGTIFLLCMQLSHKMNFLGNYIFALLAWIQLIPLIFDYIENFYLLQKIRPDTDVSTQSVHNSFQLLGKLKWAISLSVAVFCISSLAYFWLTGNYSIHSLCFSIVIIGEIILLLLLLKITKNSSKINLDLYQNIGN